MGNIKFVGHEKGACHSCYGGCHKKNLGKWIDWLGIEVSVTRLPLPFGFLL